MGKTQTTNLRAIIFAGGIGTRMWPISRTNTPKQFEKMVSGKSTLQLTVDRLLPEFKWENIYISTGQKYVPIIKKQLPKIPLGNIIGEPVMRDVAPAVGYALSLALLRNSQEPVVILWSDHIVNNIKIFKKALKAGGDFIYRNPKKFLFIGHKPRFANQNLGWIEIGKKKNQIGQFPIYQFNSWKYRPNQEVADLFFKNKKYFWNPGYWIVKPQFVLEQYKRFVPLMYRQIKNIMSAYGTSQAGVVLRKIYPSLEKISFDDAILEKLEPEKAAVLSADFGWSDIGTWQALKEALQKNTKDNISKGLVYFDNTCTNNLVYNYTKQQIVGIDLKDMVIVNTKDVLMVCPQVSMPKIKETVNEFKNNKKLRKYT